MILGEFALFGSVKSVGDSIERAYLKQEQGKWRRKDAKAIREGMVGG